LCVDTSTTRYVYAEWRMLSIYKEFNGEYLYVENSSTSKIRGIRNVILKMTSKKVITLDNVFYIADIRKNLVYSSLLSKNNFKIIFENNKFVLTKNKMFVRSEYVCNDIFKINIMITVIRDEMNNKNNIFCFRIIYFF
jgi:hypothetical protein